MHNELSCIHVAGTQARGCDSAAQMGELLQQSTHQASVVWLCTNKQAKQTTTFKSGPAVHITADLNVVVSAEPDDIAL